VVLVRISIREVHYFFIVPNYFYHIGGFFKSLKKFYLRAIRNIASTIKGGINGDIATGAIIINSIREIVKAPYGLRTMVDIQLISYFE
jgi:hypothetical protein